MVAMELGVIKSNETLLLSCWLLKFLDSFKQNDRFKFAILKTSLFFLLLKHKLVSDAPQLSNLLCYKAWNVKLISLNW